MTSALVLLDLAVGTIHVVLGRFSVFFIFLVLFVVSLIVGALRR